VLFLANQAKKSRYLVVLLKYVSKGAIKKKIFLQKNFFLENLSKEMRVRILKNLKNDLVHKAKKPEY
jgi:hypothetical protein